MVHGFPKFYSWVLDLFSKKIHVEISMPSLCEAYDSDEEDASKNSMEAAGGVGLQFTPTAFLN